MLGDELSNLAAGEVAQALSDGGCRGASFDPSSMDWPAVIERSFAVSQGPESSILEAGVSQRRLLVPKVTDIR